MTGSRTAPYSPLTSHPHPSTFATKILDAQAPYIKQRGIFIQSFAHPPAYFKAFLDYLQYLIQRKCYVKLLPVGKFKFALWNFLELFFPNIFDLQFIEFAEKETGYSGLTVFLPVRETCLGGSYWEESLWEESLSELTGCILSPFPKISHSLFSFLLGELSPLLGVANSSVMFWWRC